MKTIHRFYNQNQQNELVLNRHDSRASILAINIIILIA